MLFPEMYAVPPVRTTDASSFLMATVCLPECSVESCTTFPLVDPEKNCTVILAEPASFAAPSACARDWLTDGDEARATEAEASEVPNRLSNRQPTMTSPFRAVFEAMVSV